MTHTQHQAQLGLGRWSDLLRTPELAAADAIERWLAPHDPETCVGHTACVEARVRRRISRRQAIRRSTR